MKKSTLIFLLAAIQAFLLLFLLVSGILLGWVIVHGNAGKAVLNINRGTLLVCHKWVSVAFVVFVIAHIVLHWGWITSMSRHIFVGKR